MSLKGNSFSMDREVRKQANDMKFSKFLSNDGTFMLNAIMAMGIGAVAFTVQQAQQTVAQLHQHQASEVQEIKHFLQTPSSNIGPLIQGRDFSNAGFAPFSVQLPAPEGVTADSIWLDFTGPNSATTNSEKISTFQLRIRSRGRDSITPMLARVLVDGAETSTGGAVLGGYRQAQEVCNTAQGTWDNTIDQCMWGKSFGVSARMSEFIAFSALDAALVATVDRFTQEIEKDLLVDAGVRMTQLMNHLNASPSIDQATKDNLTQVMQDLAQDFNTAAGLHNTIASLDVIPERIDFQQSIASYWWARNSALLNNTPLPNPIRILGRDQRSGEFLMSLGDRQTLTNHGSLTGN